MAHKTNSEHKRIVEDGGGIYVAGMMGNLVLFNSPDTGSTYAIPDVELTADRVREHIAEMDAKFKVKQ
jgi:hypothetical protein